MKYRMSFSTGGLFQRESTLMAELYAELQDWDDVRERVKANNLLQARTESSINRRTLEIIGRLQTLNTQELDLLVRGSDEEQKHIAWISVCRRYAFVGEFATECLREAFLQMKQTLDYNDFDIFFARQAEWHPELEQLKDSTRKKIRQVLFKILREATLIDDKGHILPVLITPSIQAALQNPAQDLSFFPAANSSMRGTP